MQLYSCHVRPGGLVTHEVPKYDVSPAEIQLLRSMHGADAVLYITPTTEIKTSPRAVKEDLVMRYKKPAVDAAFGAFNSVPMELPEAPSEEELELAAEQEEVLS